jgi:hypothetical protein
MHPFHSFFTWQQLPPELYIVVEQCEDLDPIHKLYEAARKQNTRFAVQYNKGNQGVHHVTHDTGVEQVGAIPDLPRCSHKFVGLG